MLNSAETLNLLSPAGLHLALEVTDPNVLAYLRLYDDDDLRNAKALEALNVGVIALRSASPTLDTTIVQEKFSDMSGEMKDFLVEFVGEVRDNFAQYFKAQDGVVPKSINGIFGDDGKLGRTFAQYFDPTSGKLGLLMQQHIGPTSAFGRALDAKNKEGILSQIEGKVQQLVQDQLGKVVSEFSLDNDQSAMCRLHKSLAEQFTQLNASLGIKAATAAEAERGHVKGIVFEDDLYQVFARLGKDLGDETESVRGTVGAVPRCKKGDYLATLGDTCGAPGQKIVVEVKNQSLRLKDATEELQEAKENRGAVCGIFVYARGCEPAEVGDFRRIGEDFYVTVDKDDLAAGKPLLFLDSAFKIARALAVAAARKEAASELDLQKIHDQLDALAAWSDRIADMATKARTIQNSGKVIEQLANDLKQDLDQRVAIALKVLQQADASKA